VAYPVFSSNGLCCQLADSEQKKVLSWTSPCLSASPANCIACVRLCRRLAGAIWALVCGAELEKCVRSRISVYIEPRQCLLADSLPYSEPSDLLALVRLTRPVPQTLCIALCLVCATSGPTSHPQAQCIQSLSTFPLSPVPEDQDSTCPFSPAPL
jgi:hypothetical protein